MKQFDVKENIGVHQFYKGHSSKICLADASILYSAKDTNGLVITNDKVLLDLCKASLIESITIEEYEKQMKISPKNKNMKRLIESK